eukprot:m.201873 g.201873  ORF g.201873 m.201873 type:complete len:323 (+) comp53832_c0_seq18:250-1218(+)
MSGCGCSRTDSLCIEHAALFLTAQTTLLHATTSFSFECDYCRERLASLQLLDRHKLKHQIAARLHFRAKRQQRQLQRRQLQQETGAAQSHLQSSTTESTPVESPQALSTQLQSSALRGQNTQPENDFGPRVKATIQPDPPKPTGLTFGFPDSDSDSSSTMPKSRPRPGSFTGPAAQPSPAVLDIGGKRIKKQLAEFVGPDGQVEPEEPQQDPLPGFFRSHPCPLNSPIDLSDLSCVICFAQLAPPSFHSRPHTKRCILTLPMGPPRWLLVPRRAPNLHLPAWRSNLPYLQGHRHQNERTRRSAKMLSWTNFKRHNVRLSRVI